MKVKPSNENLIDLYFPLVDSSKLQHLFDSKEKFIELFKEQLGVKEDTKNIEIYSGSIKVFDCEEYFNKKDKTVNNKIDKTVNNKIDLKNIKFI